MPPRPKFSKEQIIDSAFHIAKTEGLDTPRLLSITVQDKPSSLINHFSSSMFGLQH